MIPHREKGECGFALLTLVFLLAVVGVFAAAGVWLLKGVSEPQLHAAAAGSLDEARRSLYIFALVHGRLPYADTDGDGREDDQTRGGLPFLDLNQKPADSWGRQLAYEVNAGLVVDRVTSCDTFKAGLAGRPTVWDEAVLLDADGNPKVPAPDNPFPVSAVILSAGPGDADGAGTGSGALFDAIAGKGDNISGSPYLKEATGPLPTPTFDDLVVYVGGREASVTGTNTLLNWLAVKDVSWEGCK